MITADGYNLPLYNTTIQDYDYWDYLPYCMFPFLMFFPFSHIRIPVWQAGDPIMCTVWGFSHYAQWSQDVFTYLAHGDFLAFSSEEGNYQVQVRQVPCLDGKTCISAV